MNSCIQGTHPSLKENTNAKATVTAIIDGTGSLGAAFGPLFVGLITDYWVNVLLWLFLLVWFGLVLFLYISHPEDRYTLIWDLINA